MLSPVLQDALNEQIKNEIQSAYVYLGMSLYTDSLNFPGFAGWLRTQWQEELGHAAKFMKIVNDRGGKVTLQGIDKPPVEYKSPLDVFQHVLANEQQITGLINKLYAVALKETDYATQAELQWFITEQVEEEKTAATIVGQLKMVGDHVGALIMMDRQLAARAG